ncbi:MAG: alpha-L-fucosidase, partial [Kiritimatiellae bacterium]|nr:alpha-L-fucosidase [Kiritimatiellia bacterium]
MNWFDDSRYGLFIHWGAYSAGARGEWAMNRERIPRDEYERDFVDAFRAERYDPADWAAKAKRWGMGYAVLTTRHHDGFSLWDSKANPWNAANRGP